ncbi:hypothetical protein FACS189440_19960 [Bacteroidia bacterium]|nr:hypothetical protein FACS189423_10660 [Bacteroidia bacterium]GHT51227.1 hypothetical protein FACS189440_19960 [Bacteroidia bacterium]
MKRLSFILISLLFATVAMQAQSIPDWLQTARTAFENSEYRTVLTNVAKIEEAVGSATKPATAYLRIMSHYFGNRQHDSLCKQFVFKKRRRYARNGQ